ncbi:MAG: glycosyltransferase family 2 protein [bacterium]
MEKKIAVSLVMPVYNEEEIIEQTVLDYYHHLIANWPESEFILVNDASNDRTAAILTAMAKHLPIRVINQPQNQGHAQALRTGFQQAQGEWILQADSDYQNDPADFVLLKEQMSAADLIIGCRQKRQDPLPRLLNSQLMRLIIRVLFGLKLSDANSPFRLIKRDVLLKLIERIPRDFFAVNLAVLILAHKFGFKVKEISVRHLPRRTGKVKLKLLSQSWLSFKQLLALRKQR